MLAAPVVDALFPVAAAAAVSAYAPLMVGAGLVAGLGAGCAVCLVVAARPLLAAAARDAATLGRHITTPTFALAALGRLHLSPVVSLWLLTVSGHAAEVDLRAALAGGALIVAANLILAAQRAAAAAPGGRRSTYRVDRG